MKPMPWELNSRLAKNSIEAIASLIKEVRGEVIDLHDEVLGDTNLSLGVRNYECCRTRIREASDAGLISGLSIVTKNKKFTFAINGVPVRFIRKDLEDNLPSGKLVLSVEAAQQYELFPDLSPDKTIIWCVVVEAFYKHVADKMHFVGYSQQGAVVSIWEIPLEGTRLKLSAVPNTLLALLQLKKQPSN